MQGLSFSNVVDKQPANQDSKSEVAKRSPASVRMSRPAKRHADDLWRVKKRKRHVKEEAVAL
jgi:hypothetical protein